MSRIERNVFGGSDSGKSPLAEVPGRCCVSGCAGRVLWVCDRSPHSRASLSPAVFLYVLLGTVTGLAGMLTTGALFYMYWIEIVLLYRTYQSKDETLGGKTAYLASAVSPLSGPTGRELGTCTFPEGQSRDPQPLRSFCWSGGFTPGRAGPLGENVLFFFQLLGILPMMLL